ncbi:MAG: CDC27 family protein, partial [Candidatus Omnitrophota bacterium]
MGQAKSCAAESQAQYQRAVSLYKGLINKGGDLNSVYFELGQLYYRQGDFTTAIEQLRNTSNSQAKKMLAISYYRLGDFTDALEAFDKEENKDDESLYYHGLTCEKMNLFDQALEAYKKIKSKEWSPLASGRINNIERQASNIDIRSISPATAQIISKAPAEELYPQAGALVLSCDEKIEVLPNNTQVSTMHYIVKILNERGKEDFAE